MDQLTGKDPKAKSSTGLGPGISLRKPSFHNKVYCLSLEPVATLATSSDPPCGICGVTPTQMCLPRLTTPDCPCSSPPSRPPGMEGRHLLSLGKPSYVSVSTNATHQRSPAPHSTGLLPRHPDCPGLANTVLVPATAVSGCRSPEMPSDDSHSPSPAAHSPASSGPATSSSLRMAAIESTFEQHGSSASVAGWIASFHRQSTQMVYDSKWQIFSEWCQDANLNPFSTTTPILAEFQTHLFMVKNFAPVTIAGYRTTVINTLEKVTGSHLCNEHLVPSLLNQFEAERPWLTRSTWTGTSPWFCMPSMVYLLSLLLKLHAGHSLTSQYSWLLWLQVRDVLSSTHSVTRSSIDSASLCNQMPSL